MLSLPSLFLYLLSLESSLDELDGDGEDEYLRCFFFLFFLLLDWCRFFDFFDRLFDEGLLYSSVLLSFEDLLRLLGLFLLVCSFNYSPTFGWHLFAPLSLVIIWLHKRGAPLSITRTNFITWHNAWLVCWNRRGFFILIKFYSNFMMAKIIFDFKTIDWTLTLRFW